MNEKKSLQMTIIPNHLVIYISLTKTPNKCVILEAKTFTTLKDVPFSIDPLPNNFDQPSCEPPVLNSGK